MFHLVSFHVVQTSAFQEFLKRALFALWYLKNWQIFFPWAILELKFPFPYNKVYKEEGMLKNDFAFTPVSGILKFDIIALISLENMKISLNLDYKWMASPLTAVRGIMWVNGWIVKPRGW